MKRFGEPALKTRLSGKLGQNRLFPLLLVLLFLIVICSAIWPTKFATWRNASAILLNLSFDTIVAIGMMLLLISGVFDLSVGSVVGATAAFASLVLLAGVPIPISIILSLCVAASFGLINGLLVTVVGINPLITTLAMMGIARGVMLLMRSDKFGLPEQFLALGQAKFLGIQLPFWIAIALIVVFTFLVSKVSFFKRYYYIGGNENAARLSGIPVGKMRVISFMLSATLAGVSGVLLTARMGGSMVTFGQGMELRVIAAAIIGGASLKGGAGIIPGALLGTIFMALVRNIMIIAKVTVYWQEIAIGVLLLAAVSIDRLLKERPD